MQRDRENISEEIFKEIAYEYPAGGISKIEDVASKFLDSGPAGASSKQAGSTLWTT
jgi:hypothetical protein